MKKIIISIFLLSTLFFSCSDFLDRNSLSELSNETFWSSEGDATKALVGCYDALQMEGGIAFVWPGASTCSLRELEFATDNGFFLWIPWVAPDVLTNNTLSPTSGLVQAAWKASYTGIARCNAVIKNVPLMTEDQISKEKANQIVCEAKFLRALYYNHLTSLYRDVPLTLDVLTVATSQVPKSPKAEVVAQIIKDLKDISGEDMLPLTTDRGRATRGAALGLLCRVYLYNEMYEEAADAAEQVIKLNEYIIDPNYSTLFTEAGNTSKEILFAVRFKNTDQSQGEGGFLAYNYGYPMEWITPYKNLANDFYCKEGKSITDSNLYDPDDDSNRDPRLTYSIVTPNSTWNGAWGKESARDAWWRYNSPSELYVRKYQYGSTDWKPDNQDFYIIRYADILLMRAEALANLSQEKTEIMGLIDEVRQRADVKMPKVEDAEGSNLSYEQLLDVIKHERRVEFAFEGFRYFDLLRWKGMEDAYAKCRAEGYGGSHIFDSKKGYVWPISQTELDNNRALVQAPEWGSK